MTIARANTVGFLLGLASIAAIAGIACIPHCDAVAYLFLPGVGIAALVFPQGIHGNAPFLFMAIAAALDILVFSIPFILIMRARARRKLAVLLLTCASLSFLPFGCKSALPPAPSTPIVAKPTYPPRTTIAPPPFRVFHTTDNSITLVTSDNASDDQIAAILWQLHDAAHNHTFAALHIPQQLVDKRDPMIWFHIYRGPQCASEKYTTGKLPCGPSYHAAADYTLGSFSNKNRDDGLLLHADDKQTELWNPDAP